MLALAANESSQYMQAMKATDLEQIQNGEQRRFMLPSFHLILISRICPLSVIIVSQQS